MPETDPQKEEEKIQNIQIKIGLSRVQIQNTKHKTKNMLNTKYKV